MSLTLAESAAVVGELRRARRKQRVASIHWVDALYQVYITGLVAVVAVVAVSGLTGDEKLGPVARADVSARGAAVAGLVAALAILLGLRSGSRGGPLALEQPDVRHVLLSPVDRGVALRGPAIRQLRFLVAVGAAVGATAGQLAVRRLPGNAAEWLLVGALFGVTVVGLGFGSALVASGTGLKGWMATGIGGLLVAWSIGDALDRLPTAPATFAGRLALWPMHVDAIGIVGTVLAVGLVGAGLRLVAGASLEAAERRTELVGQLRFAVTLQDLRTVLVLRRQLAQERPRARPWIPGLRRRATFPVFRRGLRSIARWPVSRLGRVVVLAAVAGLALRGAWSGTTPLVVLAGFALWVAALDAVEPLGQEIDHPGRTDSFPFDRGVLFLQHLPVVAVVTVTVGLLAGVVALLPFGTPVPAGVALLVGAVAGLMAGCGAVVSVVQGAPEAVDTLSMMTPEIAGTRTVFRTVWPPLMAVLGTLPLLAARASMRGIEDPPPLQAAASTVVPLVALAVLLGGWVRFRDDIHVWFREAMEQASPTKALARQAEEREAAEEREREALAESRRVGGLEAGDTAKAKPRPPRPTKAKPQVAEIPGVRGGSSAKPIGRKRDLAQSAAPDDDEATSDEADTEEEASTDE
ncbi:MAG: hypothetical protein JWM89_2480 [Acidimicrobiales bacterium]|nr:hypothetical protein [Acidimicrobiales bacterium]